jgi:hypothetical protein
MGSPVDIITNLTPVFCGGRGRIDQMAHSLKKAIDKRKKTSVLPLTWLGFPLDSHSQWMR